MKTVTLKEIVYNLKNSNNGGVQTDDVKFSDRQMAFIVNHFRDKLAVQRLNDGKNPGNYLQTLPDVEFERTRDFKSIDGFILLKTKKEIPEPVTLSEGDGIISIQGKDSLYPYQRTTHELFNLEGGSPMGKYMSKYFEYENYVYLVCPDKPNINKVDIRGVFSNPIEVENYLHGENPLRGLDFEYPIPFGVLDQLNALIMNNEYRWSEILPQDLINDAKDE